MRKKVAKHLKNCYKCIAYNPASGKVKGELRGIPKGDRPFEIIHIDHIAISDDRVTTKKHILVIIDSFTKFVKLYATKSTTSKKAIDSLKIYFSCCSKPKNIVSDRGPCFTSEECTDFIIDFDMKHTLIAHLMQMDRLKESIELSHL